MPIQDKALLSKKERITKEEQRLFSVFTNIEPKRQAIIDGLIYRAAFMRIALEDLESENNANGLVEMFSQGAQEPYQRERPSSKVYISLNTAYQKIIAQLTGLLPKTEQPEEEDEFTRF